MKIRNRPELLGAALLLASRLTFADVTVGTTTALGPFTGSPATLHSSNQSPYLINWFGTDLGFSYKHGTKLKFLFGDSFQDIWGFPIQQSTNWWQNTWDDGYGEVDLNTYGNPSLFSPTNMPRIKIGQSSTSGEARALNPGGPGSGLPLDLFKTPEGGFSNGTNEFGIFFMGKPLACATNAECSSTNPALSCDTGLGWWVEAPWSNYGLTGGCLDTQGFCNDNTKRDAFNNEIPNTGFCRDTSSSVYKSSTASGRVAASAFKMRVGIRSTTDERKYTSIEFATNKFYNQAHATAESFVPANGGGYQNQNYNVATGSGGNRRVFVWGRPAFTGVNATGRPANLYFGYVNMPTGPGFAWTMNYYTGTNGSGIPQFSTNEANAVALDLNSTVAGNQPNEPHDFVGQMSIVWVNHLHKWVMFYGGAASTLPTWQYPTCGVLEIVAGAECSSVNMDKGRIRMRTADNPWGPWAPAQDVLVGGDPAVSPLEHQYAAGGILRHPNCSGSNCTGPHILGYSPNEYGVLYAPTIHQPWIKAIGASVDLIWTVSTWDPYHVVMLRTRLNP
jgi:hypothetical protein